MASTSAHPIFYSTFHGQAERVAEMLAFDPTLIDGRNAKGLTPLQVAASRGQCAVARVLVEAGAGVSARSGLADWPPLVWACYRGHLEMVKLLLEHGAPASEAHGNPIHYAGQQRHKEVCRLLVEHGAVDDLVDDSDVELRQLFRAAYSFDSLRVDELLTSDPDLVDSVDRNGRGLLHEACAHGDIKTVRVLLRHGADASLVDARGQTPLDRATSHRHRAVVAALKTHAKQVASPAG